MFFMGLFFLMIPSAGAALAWVGTGWGELDQGREKQAVEIWQAGVNALKDNDLLYVLGVFRNLDSAVNTGRKVEKEYDVILLEKPFKGERAYFVMKVNVRADEGSLSPAAMAELQNAIGSNARLYFEEAGKYKTVAPVAPVDSDPMPEAGLAGQSAVTASAQAEKPSNDVEPAEQQEPAATEPHRAEVVQANQNTGWMLIGSKTLKENIEPLLNSNGWKLVWEIKHDFRVGMDARLSGDVSEILEKIVDAYFKRGIFLKLTWFDGNHVLLIQQVFAEHEMREVARP
ncbi:MAG: hypothetical protein AUJ57_00475 [Zetaproteobacteria bacterium CG1_02_53_45]|nr:MAG: hypothetical protein AUJ57_00475 [Zetaproteobacteria bacterium CG1_02_53_45]